MKRIIALVMAALALMFCMTACSSSSSEPEEKVYLEESEYDSALDYPDDYKGKYIVIAGQVLSVDQDDDMIAVQAYYDVENYDQAFIAYIEKDKVGKIKEDDFIRVDGLIEGVFEGENALGGTVQNMQIKADSIEVGTYDEMIAPAEKTIEVGQTSEQHDVSLTVDRVEFAKDEARVYISVKNDSSDTVSIYTFDAKAIQDGKQFEHEDNYNAGYEDMGDVLAGASKEGVLRFKGLDRDTPFTISIESYSENFDIEMEDFVFEIQ